MSGKKVPQSPNNNKSGAQARLNSMEAPQSKRKERVFMKQFQFPSSNVDVVVLGPLETGP